MELSEILSLNPLIQAWTAESPRSAATLPHTLFPLCALRVFCGEKESYGPVDSCSSYPVSCGDTPPGFGGRAQGCRKAALAFPGCARIRTNVYVDGLNLILPRRAGYPVPLDGGRWHTSRRAARARLKYSTPKKRAPMSIWHPICCWTASRMSTRWPSSSPTTLTSSFPSA